MSTKNKLELQIGLDIGQAYKDALDKNGAYPWQPWVRKAARAIAERMKAGTVWEGDGWAFVNGTVEFDIANHYLTESDLLLPIEDGEAVWITVTKLPKLEGVEDATDRG